MEKCALNTRCWEISSDLSDSRAADNRVIGIGGDVELRKVRLTDSPQREGAVENAQKMFEERYHSQIQQDDFEEAKSKAVLR